MGKFLVVDDEMGSRELLSEILGDEGHVVSTAENAQQARELRQQEKPDLVLLDIWMPDTDGVTLLKEWQRDGLLTMPVIMMSGHATIDTAVEATRIGALNFLEKPIALQKLLKTVQQGLARPQETVRPLPLHPPHPAPRTLPDAMHPAAAAHPAYPTHSIHSTHAPLAAAPGAAALAAAPPAPPPPDSRLFSLSFDLPLREARDAFERAYFEHHLVREGRSEERRVGKECRSRWLPEP